MKRGSWIAPLAALTGTASAQAPPPPQLPPETGLAAPLPGCDRNDRSKVLGYEDMLDLGEIAVRQVGLARAGHERDLARHVSPDFAFVLKSGDVFLASGRETGIAAFKLIAGMLGADRYEIAVPFNGPFLSSRCFRQKVTVTFRHSTSEYAQAVDFFFEDDVLVSATGRTDYYREGALPSQASG